MNHTELRDQIQALLNTPIDAGGKTRPIGWLLSVYLEGETCVHCRPRIRAALRDIPAYAFWWAAPEQENRP